MLSVGPQDDHGNSDQAIELGGLAWTAIFISAAVINCFNLEDQAAARTIELEPARFGLDPAKHYGITGAPSRRNDDRYTIDATIPSRGHVLVEVV